MALRGQNPCCISWRWLWPSNAKHTLCYTKKQLQHAEWSHGLWMPESCWLYRCTSCAAQACVVIGRSSDMLRKWFHYASQFCDHCMASANGGWRTHKESGQHDASKFTREAKPSWRTWFIEQQLALQYFAGWRHHYVEHYVHTHIYILW